MPKINLLYIITKLELGGAQKHLLSLIRGLNKEKYNIFLFTARQGLLITEALAIDKITLKRSAFLERPINPFKDVLALIEICCCIKKNKIQIVHTHSSKAGIIGRIAAKLAGIKVVVHTVHGWSFHDYQPKIVYYFYLALEKICALFTSKIITVSDFDRNKGIKSSIGRQKQYILIRYGINPAEFKGKAQRNQARSSLGLNNSDPLIGMVACLKPQKSPLDFIKLAGVLKNDFPDAKFVIIGDGPLRKPAEVLVAKLNLGERFILAGWQTNVPLILAALDLFLLTSSWEGLPIVVLEAMASGLPLVATDTGGIREAVEDKKTGYLVRVGDIAAMREHVEELLNNPLKKDEFVRSSMAVIDTDKFSFNGMLRNTEEMYSNLWEDRENA